jgi:hypothetical protein
MATNQLFIHQFRLRRGLVFGVIIVTALFSFEVFNYSTTVYALSDLLGELKFAGIRWATILAVAFCGIDFAGIARLFTPSLNNNRPTNGPTETWYLFGAWLLAATMNAMLTWWGVSLAVLGHQTLGNAVVDRQTLVRVVPIFVAVLVWLIRVLIIGTFSVAGDRLFAQDDQRTYSTARPQQRPMAGSMTGSSLGKIPVPRSVAASSTSHRPAPKASLSGQADMGFGARAEPTYHSVSASSAKAANPGTNGARSLPNHPTPPRSNSQYR